MKYHMRSFVEICSGCNVRDFCLDKKSIEDQKGKGYNCRISLINILNLKRMSKMFRIIITEK